MKRFSVQEAAKFLGVDEQVIYKLKNKDLLRSLNGLKMDLEFSEYELKRYNLKHLLKEQNKSIRIMENQEYTVFDLLSPLLKNPGIAKVIIDVAFLKKSGWNLIKDDIQMVLENKGEIEIILGLDFAITDPEPVREMLDLKSKGFKIDIFCYKNGNTNFHPKFYLIEDENGIRTSIFGSSNLTSGGLKENVELNSINQDPEDKDLIDQQLYLFHANLLRSLNLFIPTIESMSEYEKAAKRAKRINKIRDKALSKVEDPFNQTVEGLKKISQKTAGGTSQEGIIIEALSSLTPAVPEGWIHLDQIYDFARKINERDQLGWNVDRIETSIRGRLNNNYVNFDNKNDYKGKAIFVRKSRGEGLYKLATK